MYKYDHSTCTPGCTLLTRRLFEGRKFQFAREQSWTGANDPLTFLQVLIIYMREH